MIEKKRSRGITILSVTEMVLGSAGVLFATSSLAQFLIIPDKDTNVGAGFLLIFALMGYIASAIMLITGILSFKLRPAGRILSIIISLFLLPLSIFLIIYLLRADVSGQFG